MVHEWQRGQYRISTDKKQLDTELIHGFLSRRSYWATGRPMETVKRSIENSLVFGLYQGQSQVGFARVVTDYATFAWLADVFILEPSRGQGLGKWLVEVIVSHPDLHAIRRLVLATKDAHKLYSKVGFTQLNSPERWMERFSPQA